VPRNGHRSAGKSDSEVGEAAAVWLGFGDHGLGNLDNSIYNGFAKSHRRPTLNRLKSSAQAN
jgi:hypothetical protein